VIVRALPIRESSEVKSLTIARIYRPTRGATQSGHARTKAWLLEYERTEPLQIEPLMGWTGSSETEMQVKVPFDTREEAVAFAERRGIAFEIEDRPPEEERRGLSYSDNFKPGRLGQWTH
jgi:hypothetical protein